MIIGKPCGCHRMREAIADQELFVGVIKGDSGGIGIVVGIPTIEPEPSGIDPIQYCPWCGNAAIELMTSKEDDEGELVTYTG